MDTVQPEKLPRLLAFDLDGTLWEPEMYQLWGGGAPFTLMPNGNVKDRKGKEVYLLGNSREILEMLITDPAWDSAILATASTCDEPSWARECLTKFELKGKAGEIKKMGVAIHQHEIYKAPTKQTHFKQLKQKTGIPYSDMIFFDNQMNNIKDVSQIGVHSVYCPDGLTNERWEAGLRGWRNQTGKTVK